MCPRPAVHNLCRMPNGSCFGHKTCCGLAIQNARGEWRVRGSRLCFKGAGNQLHARPVRTPMATSSRLWLMWEGRGGSVAFVPCFCHGRLWSPLRGRGKAHKSLCWDLFAAQDRSLVSYRGEHAALDISRGSQDEQPFQVLCHKSTSLPFRRP